MFLQKKRKLNKATFVATTAIKEGNQTVNKRELAQIIDTTLLKCYLQVTAMSL